MKEERKKKSPLQICCSCLPLQFCVFMETEIMFVLK